MPKLQYIGHRAYVEFPINGTMRGFARGTIQEVPQELLTDSKEITRSGKLLKKLKLKENQKMVEAVEPVIEEPVVEEPVVEEPVVDVEVEQMVEAIANDDSSSADSAFNESWTRNEMVKWMKARGQSVPRCYKGRNRKMAHTLLENAAGEQ